MASRSYSDYVIERLELMLEAALEGQEAALATQESILNYSLIPGRHRQVIADARKAIRLSRKAARSLRIAWRGTHNDNYAGQLIHTPKGK